MKKQTKDKIILNLGFGSLGLMAFGLVGLLVNHAKRIYFIAKEVIKFIILKAIPYCYHKIEHFIINFQDIISNDWNKTFSCMILIGFIFLVICVISSCNDSN